VLKKVFGRKKKTQPEDGKELSIEDLVTLERYEEAAEKLKERVRDVPKDLHAHLKLAEVYIELKSVNKALDEYLFVADSYADDGFFDKGIALLAKAKRLAPGDDTLPRRIEQYRRMKKLEDRRRHAIKGLLSNRSTGVHSAANSAIEVELLWNKIAKSHLVDQLRAENLEKLFSVMEMVKTKDGQLLAEIGSSLPLVYLVVDGEVEAGFEMGGRYVNVRSFSSGDLIGDSALLERKPWPASYRVTRPGTVFKLDRDGLEKVMAGNEDPVAFLSVLRQQQNDRDVAVSLQKLRAPR